MPLQTITIIRLFSLSLYYPWRDPRFVGAKTRTHTTHGNSPLSWLGQEIRHDKAKPHGRAFFHMHMSSPHNTGSIRIGRPDIFRHSQFCVARMYPLIGWAGLLVGEVQPVQRKRVSSVLDWRSVISPWLFPRPCPVLPQNLRWQWA